MAKTYQIPGVYVEEISPLGSSVAQIPTAIPAFIWYTEKAGNITAGDLSIVPRKVSSLMEYQKYYGIGPFPQINSIELDTNNKPVSVTFSYNFYLYNSLRLFYANDGGECYIVSVGDYSSQPSVADFYNEGAASGLTEIAKIDEVTLLVMPDASLLPNADLFFVQQQALTQCNELGDRFAILDVPDTTNGVADFRMGIGIDGLSYGAACGRKEHWPALKPSKLHGKVRAQGRNYE